MVASVWLIDAAGTVGGGKSEIVILDPTGADTLRRLFPDSELKLMRGIGHLPMMEAPEIVAWDYLKFPHPRVLRPT